MQMRTSNEHEQARRANIKREREQLARLVARTLRSLRYQRRIKQAKLAYLMGVGDDVISNIERRRTEVSVVDAILWTRHLDMDIAHMLEWLLYEISKYYGSGSRTRELYARRCD